MTGEKYTIIFAEKEKRIPETIEQLMILIYCVKISGVNTETHTSKQKVIQFDVYLHCKTTCN